MIIIKYYEEHQREVLDLISSAALECIDITQRRMMVDLLRSACVPFTGKGVRKLYVNDTKMFMNALCRITGSTNLWLILVDACVKDLSD